MITYPFTGEGVAAALDALGADRDRIAANLQALGFKGYIDNSGCCPIANYLRRCVPVAEKVRVDRVDVSLSVNSGPDLDEVIVLAPTWVTEFIDAFDAEVYPHLIEEAKFHG